MGNSKKLVGPWRTIHGAVWLIGLAILFWQGWWWPGILVLVAVSGLVEAVIQLAVPGATVPEEPAATPAVEQGPDVHAPTPAHVPPVIEHRAELLPAACPKCSAPVRGNEVKWTGPQSADCPYCGANLPMKPG